MGRKGAIILSRPNYFKLVDHLKEHKSKYEGLSTVNIARTCSTMLGFEVNLNHIRGACRDFPEEFGKIGNRHATDSRKKFGEVRQIVERLAEEVATLKGQVKKLQEEWEGPPVQNGRVPIDNR